MRVLIGILVHSEFTYVFHFVLDNLFYVCMATLSQSHMCSVPSLSHVNIYHMSLVYCKLFRRLSCPAKRPLSALVIHTEGCDNTDVVEFTCWC